MKKLLFSIVLLSFLATNNGWAAGPDTKKEWKPLFTESLSNATYDKEAWTYEDGVLTASKDNAIWTNLIYENFILELEFMNDKGTNSGVVVYCTDRDNWISNSVEIQIADDYSEENINQHPRFKCGAIYGHLGPNKENVVKKAGEWNKMKIICKGQRITVTLNGKKITDMDMSEWTSGTKNPDGTEIPSWLPKPFAELPTAGYIGLQGKHGNAKISFRKMKIREL